MVSSVTAPFHGGRLQQAANEFGIAAEQWLDLSTGVNPEGWPVPHLPAEVWQRLPENDDALEQAAARFYGRPMLAVPGSQWAIQTLPMLFAPTRVWIPRYGYAEHAFHWRLNGHQLETYDELPDQHQLAPDDIVIAVNPNNPTGYRYQPDQLLGLAMKLQQLSGHLLVDEAFMDPSPRYSLLSGTVPDNLIVLRSLGKFFGLAGIRLGFICCDPALQQKLQQRLGPWAISHPARYVGALALQDTVWQQHAQQQIKYSSEKLTNLLSQHFAEDQLSTTALFVTLTLEESQQARQLYQHCGQHAVLVRIFPEWQKIRFGLADDFGLNRLAEVLEDF
ncbi:histidinol-phosphate/aromatic aminotransferase and cobyric acid decarboxylase [Gynuella sunshinyii YC6258]|uniref:threonine-phosphate decarboxylase n=1 Tax=Gynuella sunshinyii YC6258 TaxID=1445510 RepID=A0A0C5VGU0_9GAMM|nr:histidinol-phosphate/aromatic aminotransferase and cobyric acid decarboxylase [Gynuella sunshinyii YC6258]